MQISYLDYRLGLRLYTGDAKLDPDEGKIDVGPNKTYSEVNAGKYRLGALSFGANGLEGGWTSEGIRNATQNGWHDIIGSSRFEILREKFPGRPYFQYSTGYNYTLW